MYDNLREIAELFSKDKLGIIFDNHYEKIVYEGFVYKTMSEIE